MAIPLITFMFVPVQIFGSSESMCWCFAPFMGSGPQSACGYASSIADLFSMFFRSLFARVCVCLCNICIDVKPNLFYFFSLLLAGGHSISLGLCPTKLPVKRDIQLGQLDIPAIRLWHGANPRTPTTTISYIHGRRNLNFFDVISYVVYMVIFMHVKGFSSWWIT